MLEHPEISWIERTGYPSWLQEYDEYPEDGDGGTMMQIDNAIQILKPDPDSHYRLRPCQVCDDDDVAYVQYDDDGQELWRAQCFTCGHAGQGREGRHEAQAVWNGVAG